MSGDLYTRKNRIEIPEEDHQRLIEYTKTASKTCSSRNATNYLQGNQGNDYLPLKGYSAEYIFHRYKGKQFDWKFYPYYTKRDVLIEHNGMAYITDIKASVYEEDGENMIGMLDRIYKENLEKRKINAIIGVKMAEDLKSGEVLGIITFEKFARHCQYIRRKNDIPCVSEKYLTDIDDSFLLIR